MSVFTNNNTSLGALPGRVSILGAARSGLAAARYLLKKNVAVFISDAAPTAVLEQSLGTNGLSAVAHEAGGHTDRVLAADLLVISPGVPSSLPIIRAAHERGIPVWSEIELAFRQSRASWLAITGSSGKSTTVSMLGAILAGAKRESVVAGNIGLPLIAEVPPMSADGVVAAEISSFQLENIDLFKPRVACVINLMKNHLDRYPGEQEYYAAKMKIADNLDKECWLVVNGRDQRLTSWASTFTDKTRVGFFGCPMAGYPSVWQENGSLISTYGSTGTKILDVKEMLVVGSHNYDNAAAAAAMAQAFGIDNGSIAAGLKHFESLPHRMQFAGFINGVRFYNDSKSTTAESVLCAVTSFAQGVHLIAGGRDKGCDFSMVSLAIGTNVKKVYLIGEASERIASVWHGLAEIVLCPTLQSAIDAAIENARAGDAVILSPGCSSFDMFRDYEERGNAFVAYVKHLALKGT